MAEKMPVEQVADLVFGQWMARVVYVIARLGIADHVAPAAQSAAELAAATQTHAPSLYRVLRAATTIGVLTEDAEGRFALTEMGDCLRSDHPAGLRWMSMLLNDEWEWKTWEYLPWSVETGQSAFEHIYGMNRFEYLQRHPESRVFFDRAMTGYSALHNTAVVASYPLMRSGMRYVNFRPPRREPGGHPHVWNAAIGNCGGAKPGVTYPILQ